MRIVGLFSLITLLSACESEEPSIHEPPCGQDVAVTALAEPVIGTRTWFEDGAGNGTFTSWRAEVVDDDACGFDRRVDVFAMTVHGPVASFRIKEGAATVLEHSEGTLQLGLVDGKLAGRFTVRKGEYKAAGVFLADGKTYDSCATRQWPSDATREVEARLTAAGKQLIDCRDEDPAIAGDCIADAQAAGNGFVATWSMHEHLHRAYIGEPVADGYRVLQSEAVLGSEPSDAEQHVVVECASFAREDECSDPGVCFACVPADDLPTTLCEEAK